VPSGAVVCAHRNGHHSFALIGTAFLIKTGSDFRFSRTLGDAAIPNAGIPFELRSVSVSKTPQSAGEPQKQSRQRLGSQEPRCRSSKVRENLISCSVSQSPGAREFLASTVEKTLF
jgi:hypothetical protein